MYNYSTYCTNRVPTRLVHQVRVYAFGAPTTRLRVWCTYEALTNQGGGASVYRPRSLLYTIDSHHYPKEHTILYVFRAPGSDSLVLLSQYKYKLIRHKLYRGLQPIKILVRLEEVILWDFIIKLLKLKDFITKQNYNIILVIVDKLIV